MRLGDHPGLIISLHLHWQSNQIRNFSTNTIGVGLEVQPPPDGICRGVIEDRPTDRSDTGPKINSPVLFDVHSFATDSAKVPNVTHTGTSGDEEAKQIWASYANVIHFGGQDVTDQTDIMR
jgi:hypothetical protein